ncbi:MAG TPA: anthranilate phosphoribosyltransferase [Chloroflexota bacterium]|nr:anthranilate phosphoribosyltransferase [Chloroflexota bacterium]
MAIKEAIVKIVDGGSLSEDEAAAAMIDIVEGQATEAQIGAFAAALRMKGETVEEIAGLARVMRDYSIRVQLEGDVTDLVGTGGDASHTFNISTISALVVAAAGGRIAKHGNAGITSSCGSADILKALEIATDLNAANVANAVNEAGFGFMFAPAFQPSLKHAGPARQQIGIRTVFNILGPLTNPARANHLLIGAAVGPLAPKLAMALSRLGVKRALVVHGHGGLDELSLSGASQVFEVNGSDVTSYEVGPDKFGLTSADLAAIQGGTVEANLTMANEALSGKPGPIRDVVLLNAGAGLYASELADTIKEGIDLAADVIGSGRAREKVEQVREVTQRLSNDQQAVPA